MTINKTIENETLVLTLEGRLDTSTAPLLETTLVPAFDEAATLMLDFSKLAYISSAGLRVLLTAQKTAKEKNVPMTITGVSEEVMNVFEMTGFSDILNIT